MGAPEPISSTCPDKRVVKLGETPVLIGRASTRVPERAAKISNLCFTNSHISKEHARLLVQNNEVLIEDMNSSFGTIKNDDLLVPFNRVQLKEGDVLGFVLNRSLSYLLTMRNNRGFLKTVPLSMISNPKIHIRFSVVKIDLKSRTIVLERHSAFDAVIPSDGVLTTGSRKTLVNQKVNDEEETNLSILEKVSEEVPSTASAETDKEATKIEAEDSKELSSMSFSNLLNSDSCECTDVSDSNEPQCDSDDNTSHVKNNIFYTESEAEFTMSESESCADSTNDLSDDDESEILVNLGPDSDFGEDQSEVLVNLVELGGGINNDQSGGNRTLCDLLDSVDDDQSEGLTLCDLLDSANNDQSEGHESESNCADDSFERSANEHENEDVFSSEDQEVVFELSEESDVAHIQGGAGEKNSTAGEVHFALSDEVIDLSDEESDTPSSVKRLPDVTTNNLLAGQLRKRKQDWCPASRACLDVGVSYSRKRSYEEIEITSMQDFNVPPAKRKQRSGILWEVGKGAMYVTGTLMALLAYGGYLVNSKA